MTFLLTVPGGPEISNAFMSREQHFGMQRRRHFDGIAKHDNETCWRLILEDVANGDRGGEVPDGGFADRAMTLMRLAEQTFVCLSCGDGLPLICVEEMRFLDFGQEDLRMAAEPRDQ